MAYPTASQVQAAAQQFGADQALVFAFAAVNQRIPRDFTELAQFDSSLTLPQGWYVDRKYLYAYASARGKRPEDPDFGSFMAAAGYYNTTTHELTKREISVGQGYPPGSALFSTTSAPATPASPATPFDWNGLLENKPLMIGGAIVLGLLLLGGGGGSRRRGLF